MNHSQFSMIQSMSFHRFFMTMDRVLFGLALRGGRKGASIMALHCHQHPMI